MAEWTFTSLVMEQKPVQSVPCHLPSVSWDRTKSWVVKLLWHEFLPYYIQQQLVFWGLFLACIAVTQWEINQLAVGYMVEEKLRTPNRCVVRVNQCIQRLMYNRLQTLWKL